jgi:hypothetical protein
LDSIFRAFFKPEIVPENNGSLAKQIYGLFVSLMTHFSIPQKTEVQISHSPDPSEGAGTNN